MNHATKIIELPALTVDLLKANGVLIDNVFANLWRKVGMRTILSRAGFNKRSGTLMSNVMFSLMLWLWLQKESYKHCLRKAWESIRGQKCQAKIVDAELNLAENKDTEEWINVSLLFVRGYVVDTQTTVGKHDWAVFLTTDTALSSAEILELYALRWAIEIYQPCCIRKSVYKK